MQANQTPTLVPLPFAANGTKNTIPEASQIGITPGAASLNDGFPPLTFTPIAAGGVPPAGADFNGILNLITQSIRWAHAGGRYAFSSTFAADANVGGYPAGAVIMSADQQGSWLSLNDNNTDNPDSGPGTKWVPSHAYGVTAITGLASSNVTLTPAQAMKPKITLAGTLTANVQVIFPAWTRDWTVVNNTTGSFTVTAKTASGTGVALAAGQQRITGDGTNIVQPAESIAAATLSTQPMQLGQAVGRLINVQRFIGSGTYTRSSGVSSVIVEVIGGGGAGGGSVATTSTQMSAGGGGGSGAYARAQIPSVPASVSVTVGAGGTASAGASGGAGGASSFGSYVSVGGGNGGQSSAAGSAALFGGPGGGSTSISFGSGAIAIAQGQGGGGDYSTALATSPASVIGGKGGASYFGGGGSASGGGASGNSSSSYGGGGSGSANGGTAGVLAGGPGASGIVIVYEFS
ncbi:glycine-rich domain-containing protein [Burkholderia multivorans]|uniref:glycine-rich domain-containing protein n=1 Tax=Burkholderia multivorans TaxID=87883 RepID=UPI0021C0BE69|nr:hypothetical protein [Burkholderia multivorans]